MEEGWSRDTLLNFMDNGLYEREGKALTNFTSALPETTSDFAQELTKDPYNFAFTGITNLIMSIFSKMRCLPISRNSWWHHFEEKQTAVNF